MTSVLRRLGAEVDVAVASREAGYGLGVDDINGFAERGCAVVIAGDCGTSDLAALTRARELNLDTIVVDHHTVPDADREHPALALVNPLRTDSAFPFRGMASVGLAFYLMAALRTALDSQGLGDRTAGIDLRDDLDLVALGTVADMVPLTEENRILTASGLSVLARARRPGLAALMSAAGVRPGQVDSKAISWKLAPRLNAPGRLGDARPALDLLLASDAERSNQLVGRLQELNDRRRAEQDRVLGEADQVLESSVVDSAVVVAGEGWGSGVVGIVAAKLVDRYALPSFVIAVDPQSGQGRGSARSAKGINLYRALHECRDHLVRYGGHAAAAGFTVERDRVAQLAEALQSAVREQGLAEAPASAADAEVELGDVDEKLVGELSQLAPFGQSNEEPVLVSRGVRVAESRRVGDGSHLKLLLAVGNATPVPAIAFGRGELELAPGDRVDALYSPGISTWSGRSRVELNIRDLHPL